MNTPKILGLGVLLGFSVWQVDASSVAGSISLDFQSAALGNGKSGFFVHAERFTINLVDKKAPANDSSFYASYPPPPLGNGKDIEDPVPASPGVSILLKKDPVVRASPTVGLDDLPKPGPGITSEAMLAQSGDILNFAVGEAGIVVKSLNNKPYIYGDGRTSKGVGGTAAGAAEDPFDLDDVTLHDYTETLNVTLDLSTDYGLQTGGTLFAGVDSRVGALSPSDVDNFLELGEPLDRALWYLAISAVGPINGVSDLSIDFHINPEARSLGILNPTYSDDQLKSWIASQFTFAGGVASLTDASLFPAGVDFVAQRGARFGLAVNAGLAPVSEGSVQGCLALSCLLLFTGYNFSNQRRPNFGYPAKAGGDSNESSHFATLESS